MGTKIKQSIDHMNQHGQSRMSAHHDSLNSINDYSLLLYDKIPFGMILDVLHIVL